MKRSFSIRDAAFLMLALAGACTVFSLMCGIRPFSGEPFSSGAVYAANWGLSLHETAEELFYAETDHTFGGGIRCSVLLRGSETPYGLSPAAPRKDPQNIVTVTHGDHAEKEILTLFLSAAEEADIPEEHLPPEVGWRWTMAKKDEDCLIILSDETTVWIEEILQQKGAW